jgi:hypothetical protein
MRIGHDGRQRAVVKKASGAAPLDELVAEAERCSYARLFADAIELKRGFISLDSAKEASLPMINDRH